MAEQVVASVTNGDASPDFDPAGSQGQEKAKKRKRRRSHHRRLLNDLKHIQLADRPLRIGPLLVATLGVLSFPRITRATQRSWDAMPDEVTNDEAIFESASANSKREEVEQVVKSKARAKAYSHPQISQAVRFAKSVIQIVKPMLAVAQQQIDELSEKMATSTEEIIVREGSWADLRFFTNFPTLVKLVGSLVLGYYMVEFELITMMKYVTAAYPKLVLGTKLASLPWLTPARTALAMTFTYVVAMYFILEYLLLSGKAVLNLKITSRVRKIMAVVALATPLLFAWVAGVAYEGRDIRSEMGKLFTPGMPGYMLTTMCLCVLGLAAITWFLKQQVDSLFTIHRHEVPVRAHDKGELGKALLAQSCCQDVLSQAQATLQAAEAVAVNAEINAVATLWEEFADRRARADQAYVKHRKKRSR